MWRYKEQDLGKFPDCCALTDTGRCSWLTLANCRGSQCMIRRTPEENNKSLQHVNERLLSLDISTQIHIAKKYYGGSMPWNGGKTVKAYRAYKSALSPEDKKAE
ncbi:MAG: hypothetical protein GX370_08400 [Clostridia bacterium]|jgi:hypothetical protein|nr:hypothetical protein [Clostridia bacterium]